MFATYENEKGLSVILKQPGFDPRPCVFYHVLSVPKIGALSGTLMSFSGIRRRRPSPLTNPVTIPHPSTAFRAITSGSQAS